MADRRTLWFIFAATLASVSSIGLLGRWDDWADLVNQFTPIWICIAAGGLFAIASTGGWRRAPWSGLLLVFAVIAQGTLLGPEVFAGDRPAPSSAGAGPRFSVLTFNVWNDSPDRAATIDRIVKSGADVVTLQEGMDFVREYPDALMGVYPYRATCDDWWGCEILILSKRPILDHHFAAPAPEGSGGPLWAVWITTTATDGRPVRVLSTHFAWPVPPAFRQRQVERLGEIVRTLKGESLIVTGDCNADGSSFALRNQDSKLEGLVRRTRQIFSWPAIIDGTHWPAPFPVLAIDQIYASRDWRTTEARRLPRSGSDHYPILVGLARDARPG